MSTTSALLADALGLVAEDLCAHLDEADCLANHTAEWSDDDMDRARQLINDLLVVIRGLLIEHRRQPGGDCRTCTSAWPCPVVTPIHAVVKDSQRQFVALVLRARDER